MDDIPNEVLLMVFEELPYSDLKHSIPFVCKRFNALLKTHSPCLDRALFRDKPTASTLTEEHVPHPILNLLHFGPRPKHGISNVTICNGPYGAKYTTLKRRKLTDLSVYHENATCPAVSKASMKVFINQDIIHGSNTKNGGALTVGDVVSFVVWHKESSFFSKPGHVEGPVIYSGPPPFHPSLNKGRLSTSTSGSNSSNETDTSSSSQSDYEDSSSSSDSNDEENSSSGSDSDVNDTSSSSGSSSQNGKKSTGKKRQILTDEDLIVRIMGFTTYGDEDSCNNAKGCFYGSWRDRKPANPSSSASNRPHPRSGVRIPVPGMRGPSLFQRPIGR